MMFANAIRVIKADSLADKLSVRMANFRKAYYQLSPILIHEVAKMVRDRIVMQARRGRTGYRGKDQPLPGLSARYINYRLRFSNSKRNRSRRSQVDPIFFRPRKSNLTFTGQYLKSISIGEIDQGKKTFTIEPSGVRRDGLTNQDLATYLEKQNPARSIYYLDEITRKRAAKMVLSELRAAIRNKVLNK
jgi:hypothetical protein